MKRRIFLVCLFYCFFRLPIYESIAAIFWQSASYVYNFVQVSGGFAFFSEIFTMASRFMHDLNFSHLHFAAVFNYVSLIGVSFKGYVSSK